MHNASLVYKRLKLTKAYILRKLYIEFLAYVLLFPQALAQWLNHPVKIRYSIHPARYPSRAQKLTLTQ